MAEQAADKKTELFDGGDDERFLLASKAAITNVLIELSKRPDILTPPRRAGTAQGQERG